MGESRFMNLERINDIAFKVMGKRKAHAHREQGYIYYHGQRVAKLSLNLRQSLHVDEAGQDEIMYAGALFHDVTKGIEPHHRTGAALIGSLLNEACTAQELEGVAEIIALHNARRQENLPFQVKIVQDADILDHFGSMEIWLKFMYSASKEENVFDAIRMWNGDEHKSYLAASRQALHYELSKAIFDQRVAFENEFRQRFELECGGAIDL